MFQDFEDHSDKSATAERLAALRAKLKALGFDGFLVPRADEHQGEYVPASAERLAWLTGFTGSAGLAVILQDRAALFVDGRYTLAAGEQIDTTLIEPVHSAEKTPRAYLEEHLRPGMTLGYDSWLHTPEEIERYAAAATKAGAWLKSVPENPLDAVWTDRPPVPKGAVIVQPLNFSGKESAQKRGEIARTLSEAGADAAVLTLPDSIAWLLNIRGADIKHNPVPLAFAILNADATLDLAIDPDKLDGAVRAHLGDGVRLHAAAAFANLLRDLGKAGKRVLADPATAAAAIFQALDEAGAKVKRAPDPCLLPKACKTEAEIAGARAAHKRDGGALCRFLAWLAREAPGGAVDEITAVKKLESFRAETGALVDLSFDTISGSGPHGAIVHYRVTTKTNRKITPGELFLLDSGGQYRDGTTDVTRTIAIGPPPEDAKHRFTLVLKGHIALACARFPDGTTGGQLDALARGPLWQEGFDFDHGTGHGVGSFLSVHEGPQRISKAGHGQALKPGMIVSNEPGYYKTGAYGIRLENLMVVKPAEKTEGGERAMLAFETLTLAPFDTALVDPALLSAQERSWLNAYHARVLDVIGPLVDPRTHGWLKAATAAV
jgi:Xaa-Pro aminopeptidase